MEIDEPLGGDKSASSSRHESCSPSTHDIIPHTEQIKGPYLLAVLEDIKLVLVAGDLVDEVCGPVTRLGHVLTAVGLVTLGLAQHRHLRLKVSGRQVCSL